MLKLSQWNGQNLSARPHETAILVADQRPDMFFACETWFKSTESYFSLSCPGIKYVGFRCDRKIASIADIKDNVNRALPTRGGGLCTWVRDGIEVVNQRRSDGSGDVEWLALDVKMVSSEIITFCSVYVPNGKRHWDASFLFDMVRNGPTVICGDFNAHHRELLATDPLPMNASGKSLVDLIGKSGLVMLSAGIPTHKHGSQLDLWLCTPDLMDRFSGVNVGDDYGSDHYVTSTALKTAPLVRPFPENRFDYNRARWNLFSTLLSDTLQSTIVPTTASPAEVERYSAEITSAILASARRSIPVVQSSKVTASKVTPAMRGMLKKRHYWAQLYRRTGNPLFLVRANDAYQRFKDLAAEQDVKAVMSKLKDLERTRKTDSGRFFRIFDQITNGGTGRAAPMMSLQRPDGSLAVSPDEKAEILRAFYEQQFNPTPKTELDAETTSFHEQVERDVREDPGSFKPIVTSEIDRDAYITREELRSAISKLRLKAPGMDNISNLLLKRGGSTLWNHLRRLYNLSLACGYVPLDWKMAVIVPLARPGKDHSLPSGYRPVSLLPTIAKLLELILTLRLRHAFHLHKVIPDHQSGFWQNRSTADQTFRLSQVRAMARLRKEKLIAVLLDFEGAFNAVWHDGLRIKLRDNKAIDKVLVRWLSSFLSDRSFVVRVSSTFSAKTSIGSGVPQGSALSPILFAFFTADMHPDNNNNNHKASIASYADDVLLFAYALLEEVAKLRVRESLDRIAAWSRRWRLPLSPTKCQVMTFGNAKRAKCALWIGKQQLPFANEAYYLGVKYDRAGTWKPHFDDLVEDVERRLACLRKVCSMSSPLSRATRMLLYLTMIRPKLEYCCPAWIDASPSQKQRLIVLQNNCIRAMFGISLRDMMGEEDLCRLAGLQPLEKRWVELSSRFAHRALRAVPPVRHLILSHYNQTGLRGTPLGYFSHKVHGLAPPQPPP